MIRRYAEPVIAVMLAAAAAGGLYLAQRHDADLPNSRLTPGEVVTTDVLQIDKTPRNVDQAKRNAVARRYGLPLSALDGAEVDHLIPRSWGGASTVENLWVQRYDGTWNAHVKDHLEVHGLAMIRRGDLDLNDAQREIARDWKAMYKRLISKYPTEHRSEEHEQ